MGYDISLHIIPKYIGEKESLSEDELRNVVHNDIRGEYTLADTNYAFGNKNAVEFADALGISLTNDEEYQLYTKEDCDKARKRIDNMDLSLNTIDRLFKFLTNAETQISRGRKVFIYTS